jgi:pimeloyl-ACP methyl ester carboxylesterase
MLARLQQFTSVLLLGLVVLWLTGFWAHSPALALSGAVLVGLGYSVFLAIEFAALNWLNRNDPAGRARWRELLRAWWVETNTAPQVFCWWQPFRSQAIADYLPSQRQRGVVFIHGFICNRGLWTPWMRQLRQQHRAFVSVSLEPVFGSIDDYAATIDQAVQRVTQATGCAPVLICHSMGGLAARAWLREPANDQRVHHVITIGTPHHGTWLGQFSTAINGRQMRLNSPWLQQLRSVEPAQRFTRFTCWYSNCDNVVFPASTAILPAAQCQFLPGVAHVSLAFDRRVMDANLAFLRHSDSQL